MRGEIKGEKRRQGKKRIQRTRVNKGEGRKGHREKTGKGENKQEEDEKGTI